MAILLHTHHGAGESKQHAMVQNKTDLDIEAANSEKAHQKRQQKHEPQVNKKRPVKQEHAAWDASVS